MRLERSCPPRSSERPRHAILGAVVLALLALTPAALSAQPITLIFTTLDVPEAVETSPVGMNNSGRVTGFYFDSSGTQHAFVWEEGVFTTIDPPDAVFAQAELINDAGQVVGTYRNSGGATQAFLWDEGTFTTLVLPGALAGKRAINDGGQIVGTYQDSGFATHAFLWDQGVVTPLDPPGAINANAVGINAAGQVIGNYFPGEDNLRCLSRGFLWEEGTFTTLDLLPCDEKGFEIYTYLVGINSAGQIIGRSVEILPEEKQTGFLWDEGTFTPIVFSDAFASVTIPFALNDSAQVVGGYRLGAGQTDHTTHAFFWEAGTITNIDPPDAVPNFNAELTADARDINEVGVVRGFFIDDTGTIHDFLLRGGTFTTIDFPGSASTPFFATRIASMNDAGEIVGTYRDSSGALHGFLGKPAVSVSGLTHLDSLTTAFNAKPVPGGPAGTFTIQARFTNASSMPIEAPQFVVTQLTNGNLLLNADLPPGTVGARLTPDVGSDGVFSPGESFDVQFVIGLQKRTTFTFRVGLLGVTAP